MVDITRPAAPNLALAPVAYESRYVDQLNNIFRLYFNQLDTTLQAITNQLTSMQAEIVVLQVEVVVLQVEVADLQVQGNNSQALIWLDM